MVPALPALAVMLSLTPARPSAMAETAEVLSPGKAAKTPGEAPAGGEVAIHACAFGGAKSPIISASFTIHARVAK